MKPVGYRLYKDQDGGTRIDEKGEHQQVKRLFTNEIHDQIFQHNEMIRDLYFNIASCSQSDFALDNVILD